MLGGLASACAGSSWPGRPLDCPGRMPRAEDPGPSRLEAAYQLDHRDRSHVFTVVLERREDAVVLVGFTGVGARVFSLEQRGDAVESDSQLGPLLPVTPRTVASDLARALAHQAGEAPAEDGVRVDPVEGGVRIVHEACDYEATVRGPGLARVAP